MHVFRISRGAHVCGKLPMHSATGGTTEVYVQTGTQQAAVINLSLWSNQKIPSMDDVHEAVVFAIMATPQPRAGCERNRCPYSLVLRLVS